MILSIIIPVYNVEKYIEKCLISCLMQDINRNDYEIIIVNDGTPDNSMIIIDSIVKEYQNITIINQENQGLSAARNSGLKFAKGEYIWFIDSDDFIEYNCLRRITSQLKDNIDILQLQHRLVFEKSNEIKDIPHYIIKDSISGSQLIKERGFLPTPVQFSIYRKQFLQINNLDFVIGIYHEDSEFKPRATWYAKSISSDSKISYNYLQRSNGSITSNFKLKNAIDLFTVMNNTYSFITTEKIPNKYRFKFYKLIGMNLNSLLFGIHRLDIVEQNQLIPIFKKNRHILVAILKSHKVKYIIESIILLFNIKVGIKLHKIFR